MCKNSVISLYLMNSYKFIKFYFKKYYNAVLLFFSCYIQIDLTLVLYRHHTTSSIIIGNFTFKV